MREPLTATLSALRDVEGVRGSFFFASDGQLLARDLPAVVDQHALSEAGVRVARLHEALTAQGEALDACNLRFSEHRLHLRTLKGGYLGVLSDIRVNVPTLKMALTLVTRRLGSALEHGPVPSAPSPNVMMTPLPPTTASPPVVAPQPREAEAPVTKRPLMYRGRPVG